MKLLTAFGFMALLWTSCLEFDQPYKVLAPGIWRAELLLTETIKTKERRDDAISTQLSTEGILPFTFEVITPNPDSIYLIIHNGDERIRVTDLVFGKNKETARDSLTIHFPIYDSYIKVEIDGSKMDGFWVVNSKKDYKIPFSARFGKSHRFTTLKKTPVMNIEGLWETTFSAGEDAFDAIGSFSPKGNHLTGTFMTETGDFRFLSGTIQDNKLYLSSFDGSHAFLFEGRINPVDSTIQGSFLSGKHYKTTWLAKKNEHAKLNDPNDLVSLKADPKAVHFTLPSADGKMVSLDDPALAGKPKILQIMGTWCPNCRDEGAFLAKYFTEQDELPIEVIGLAFEKYDHIQKSMDVIKKYKQALNIPYDIVYAGKPKREEIFKLLPQLNNFVAYPTLLFLNGENEIVKVHTGFNGPATPAYALFKLELDKEVKILVENAKK